MESTGSSSSSSVAAAAAAAAVGTMFACAAFCCLASAAAAASVVAESQTADAAGVSESRREYCAADEFRPACTDREVIMITSATYGRMTFGECVKQDYGYLGCSIDVLDLMDGFCSGRRTCSVKLPDASLEEVNTCPKEFKAYLNVSFKCVEVDTAACNGCTPPTRVGSTSIAKLTRSRGFIASASTLDSPSGLCGSAQCPWYIEVQSGQTINLTLYDFSSKHTVSSPPPAAMGGFPTDQCTRLAVVKEAAHLRETPICYRQSRVQSVYSSVSQSIQIHVVSKEVIRTKGPFLIHYEVIGCPDFHPPENAQLKRMGDTVIVECRDPTHGLRWESRCVDSKWEGEIGTCPGSSLQTTLAPNFLTLPLGVLVSVVLGIALVIGVLIVTFGIVCLRRQQRDVNDRTGNIVYLPPGQCYELREPFHGHPTGHSSASVAASSSGRKVTVRSSSSCSASSSVHSGGCKDRRVPAGGGRRYVYAHNARMESRPLPSIPDINAASCSSPSSTGGEQGPCCRGPHRGDPVELGSSCPHHFRASTMGRNASQKSARTRRTRAGSGGGACGPHPSFSGFPAVAAPTPPRGPNNPSVPQHYTVLDPIEVQQQLTGTLRAAAGRAVTATSSPRGPNTSTAAVVVDPGTYEAGASPGPPPKPPLLPSMEGASSGAAAGRGRCGEGGIEKSSCREITLRPTRQRTNFDSAVSNNSGGNSSWP